MKRCLVFNPYFAVLGGGERYTVALGSVIGETHEVTYASPHPPDPARAEHLGFPPVEVQQLASEELPRASTEYDLAVVMALYLPPPCFATRSLLVVQFPRGDGPAGGRVRRWMTTAALRRYHRLVYSEYVRSWLKQTWRVDAEVLMPPVDLADDRPRSKENLIVSVGRFMGRAVDDWNNKRQDVLIEAFSRLPPELRESWRLVLVGGYSPSPEMDEYLDELKQRADGLNVSFEVNVSAERLSELLSKARLYWHASGFERPPSAPEQAEHFGISTVEAMSSSAIPLVYADGGQLEIVTPETGRLWHSTAQLVDESAALMTRSTTELDALGAAARAASTRFGSMRFETEVRELLHRIGADRPSSGRVARVAGRLRRQAHWLSYRAFASAVARCR